MPTDRPTPNFRRGIAGAAIASAGAVALAAVMVLVFVACRWVITSATRIERSDDLAYAKEVLPDQFLMLAVIAACSGWATTAPPGRHRFAPTIVIVFFATIGLWMGITMAGLKPQRYKGMEDDPVRVAEVVYVCFPPILAAVVLTLIRMRKKDAEQSLAAESR
jgi:hypothetical protein